MAIIEGTTRGLTTAGAPANGTDEIQTVTIGTTPTSGTFTLSFDGYTTAPITWSATTSTLIANVDAALGLLPSVNGAANVTTADATLSGGAGTFTVTFVVALGKTNVPLMTANYAALVGTGATVAVATTTAGVTASGRGAPAGTLLTDTTNAKLYINTGTTIAPTWTVVGTQS